MAYCAIADVRALNPKRTYSSSSTPTQTQVEGFITQIANEIDSILSSRGLTVPVTAPAHFLAHLEQVNAYGAAALAEMAMFPEAGMPGGTPQGSNYWAIYEKARTRLEKGDLPVSVEEAQPRSFFTEHTGDTEPTEDYDWRDRKFKKSKEF